MQLTALRNDELWLGDADARCLVCQEDIGNTPDSTPILIHPDQHTHPIHQPCMERWVQSLTTRGLPPTCPGCRGEITHINGIAIPRPFRFPWAGLRNAVNEVLLDAEFILQVRNVARVARRGVQNLRGRALEGGLAVAGGMAVDFVQDRVEAQVANLMGRVHPIPRHFATFAFLFAKFIYAVLEIGQAPIAAGRVIHNASLKIGKNSRLLYVMTAVSLLVLTRIIRPAFADADEALPVIADPLDRANEAAERAANIVNLFRGAQQDVEAIRFIIRGILSLILKMQAL